MFKVYFCLFCLSKLNTTQKTYKESTHKKFIYFELTKQSSDCVSYKEPTAVFYCISKDFGCILFITLKQLDKVHYAPT